MASVTRTWLARGLNSFLLRVYARAIRARLVSASGE